jgi:putative spermidine/putrescine transport system permease protein
VYSWRLILNPQGALNWALEGLGLPTQSILYTNWAMWLVYSYIWLPFMVLPVYAALEKIPTSYLEASADLGAGALTTLRRVVLPLAVPGIAAGSIFTFSLTLGDYIAPGLVGGPSSQLIGNVVFANVGVANNVPFAAAFAMVPLVIMAIYLALMKRLGAFENL